MAARLPWDITAEMFLDETEIRRLLAHVRGRAEQEAASDALAARLDQIIVETLLFSGIRNSEFCRLTRADFRTSESRCELIVRGSGQEDRVVHVAPGLGELLLGFIREVRPRLLPPGSARDDPAAPLVLNERRKPYERTGLYRRVVRVLTEAGLGERASVQLLRHTYGYLAYKNTGGNLLFVQRQLGHAHPMITSVYAKLVNESYEDMAERVYWR